MLSVKQIRTLAALLLFSSPITCSSFSTITLSLNSQRLLTNETRYRFIRPRYKSLLLKASRSSSDRDEEDSSLERTEKNTGDPKLRAISALSAPRHLFDPDNSKLIPENSNNENQKEGASSLSDDSPRDFNSLLPPPLDPPQDLRKRPSSNRQRKAANERNRRIKMHPSKKYLHDKKSKTGSRERQRRQKHSDNNKSRRGAFRQGRQPSSARNNVGTRSRQSRYASMLPPPQKDPNDYKTDEDDENVSDDPSSLSSWEQFLGTAEKEPKEMELKMKPTTEWVSSIPFVGSSNDTTEETSSAADDADKEELPSMTKLPSIQELFPPDLSLGGGSTSQETSSDNRNDSGAVVRDQQQRDISNLFPSTGSNRNGTRRGRTLPPNSSRPQGATPRTTQSTSRRTSSSTAKASSGDAEAAADQVGGDPNLQQSQQSSSSSSASSLEGVLPVSDLFYRSSDSDEQQRLNVGGDDEELPFSAEQTDQIMVDNNKVKIRRNQVDSNSNIDATKASSKTSNISGKASNKQPQQGGGKRKMVRRGMEMLVGGVPINADPPQRSIELWYDTAFSDKKQQCKWHSAISVNTKDFGPFFHTSSQHQLTRKELGLFCEHFVYYAMKWDICPPHFRNVVEKFFQGNENRGIVEDEIEETVRVEESDAIATSSEDKHLDKFVDKMYDDLIAQGRNPKKVNANEIVSAVLENPEALQELLGEVLRQNPENLSISVEGNGFDKEQLEQFQEAIEKLPGRPASSELANFINKAKASQSTTPPAIKSSSSSASTKGFGKADHVNKNKNRSKKKKKVKRSDSERFVGSLGIESELVFGLRSSKVEIAGGGEDEDAVSIFRNVMERGIRSCMEKAIHRITLESESKTDLLEVDYVETTKFDVEEMEYGMTIVTHAYNVMCKFEVLTSAEAERLKHRLGFAFDRVVDDGELQLACAAAAKEEERWPPELRERMYEEFLFEEDAEDTIPWEDGEEEIPLSFSPDSKNAVKADRSGLFKDDGVVWDYSETNAKNSPFGGNMGPYLLEVMEQRSKEHDPKVIAIGDVHGCVDELQDLLRQCDYHPGDLIVFLGDLVSKGPDSISVVQMAREIGAIGVRGNHDFEVIRWHQAIKSGVDPPVVGSEHFHVASCLSKADVKWLYSLPWYIASKDLSALFVHAGFVSGIRLAKQNPRLMMNMRSILPDGTVTSKFFNNWPWARLWDGPQTVYFGHDADRGLQQYEHAIGLDTGCVYGGRLTACLLPEKRLVSVSAKQEYFKYRRKHYD